MSILLQIWNIIHEINKIDYKILIIKPMEI